MYEEIKEKYAKLEESLDITHTKLKDEEDMHLQTKSELEEKKKEISSMKEGIAKFIGK